MVSKTDNRIYYLREYRAAPLALVYCGSAAFDTYSNIYIDADSISLESTGTGIDDLKANEYATMLFPNPSNGSEVTMQFLGLKTTEVNYTIYDNSGKIVQHLEQVPLIGNELKLSLNSNLTNGMYTISVTNMENIQIASEQLQLAK